MHIIHTMYYCLEARIVCRRLDPVVPSWRTVATPWHTLDGPSMWHKSRDVACHQMGLSWQTNQQFSCSVAIDRSISIYVGPFLSSQHAHKGTDTLPWWWIHVHTHDHIRASGNIVKRSVYALRFLLTTWCIFHQQANRQYTLSTTGTY